MEYGVNPRSDFNLIRNRWIFLDLCNIDICDLMIAWKCNDPLYSSMFHLLFSCKASRYRQPNDMLRATQPTRAQTLMHILQI